MSLYRIMSLAFTIGGLMMCLQLLAVYGHLDATEFNLFGATQATAPLNVEPFYKNLKIFLEIPNGLHQSIVDFEPQNTPFFNGVQGLTGATEEGFLTLLLYLTTFIYYFAITTVFLKISTIFAIERDQNIFFIFQYIIYFAIIKFLGN